MTLDQFKSYKTKLKDLIIIKRNYYFDTRGSFSRIFSKKIFHKLGFKEYIDSINYSMVKKRGTIKGLHFQKPPHAETKIVTCIKGSIYDVCVDLRYGSKTFLKYHAEILSEKNKKSLLIPRGFAHGFQTLEDDSAVLYFHSTSYNKASESGISVLDSKLNINWPIKISKISKRDKNHNSINRSFKGLKI